MNHGALDDSSPSSPSAAHLSSPSLPPSTSSTTSRNGARASRKSRPRLPLEEFHFNHGPFSRDRRIEARPMTMTEEDMIRNGNTSQYHREIIGYIWRKMNEWGALDPATNPLWGQRPRVAIQILVDSYCAACAGRGAITRIHQRQNHLHFKQALDAGVRFFPDTSEEPYTITYISGTRTHSAFEARFDLMNYEKAVRYFQDTDGKGYETPEHVSLPEPMDFPSQTGDYATQKQEYGQYWLNEYAWLVNSDAVVDQGNTGRAILLAYRTYAEMNILAARHDENWSDSPKSISLLSNRYRSDNYVKWGITSSNPIYHRWADGHPASWRQGFYKLDTVLQTLSRDFIPHNPEDPFTTPEVADIGTGDDRVTTNIAVLQRSEIDRS